MTFKGDDNDDSVFIVGEGVSMAGFNGVEASGSGPCKMVASLEFGATLKAFTEVESAVTVVEYLILVGKLTSG